MVLVLHMDQLEARSTSSPYKQWVGTPEFTYDHSRVKEVVIDLLREWELHEVEQQRLDESVAIVSIRNCLRVVEKSLHDLVRECIDTLTAQDKKCLRNEGKFEVRRLSLIQLPTKAYFDEE